MVVWLIKGLECIYGGTAGLMVWDLSVLVSFIYFLV